MSSRRRPINWQSTGGLVNHKCDGYLEDMDLLSRLGHQCTARCKFSVFSSLTGVSSRGFFDKDGLSGELTCSMGTRPGKSDLEARRVVLSKGE